MTATPEPTPAEAERRRRWRLLLGGDSADSLGDAAGNDRELDAALAAVYDSEPAGEGGAPRSGGLGGSAPRVARWLGDIRQYFPNRVVQVMQRDAIERLGLTRLLLEPEMLEAVEPDVHLVGTLLTLKGAIPEQTKSTAREVVRRVVEQVQARVTARTRAAVTGALQRSSRTRRPRPRDIDWHSTIRANLGSWLPEQRTIVPERLIGHGRRAQSLEKEVVVALDQSASMAESVVFGAIFASVLGSMPALRTSMVAFDTAVADLTSHLDDPVDVLFGVQLGGGTDINRAVAYCESLISRPRQSLFVLISDLYEGGVRDELLVRLRRMRDDGVTVVVLLALADSGAPAWDRSLAAEIDELGIAAFACTPDAFPDLLAVALTGGDVKGWAEREDLARR